MSTTKVLHVFTARLANGKVAVNEVVETSYGRNASRIVDLRVKVTGHAEMVEHIGSVEVSTHPDHTHLFAPTEKLRALGLSIHQGNLNDVRAQSITAAAYRIGALAQEIATRVNTK